MQFTGTQDYVAKRFNCCCKCGRFAGTSPLIGRAWNRQTELAKQVASALSLELIEWNINPRPRHNRAFMNMMLYHVCATVNWGMNVCEMWATTSAKENYGPL